MAAGSYMVQDLVSCMVDKYLCLQEHGKSLMHF